MSGDSFYPRHRDGQVQAHANFPEMEKETLKYWEQDDTFQKSINQRPTGRGGDNEFVFYDGPPFANGLPHYGHLLTGYVKDVAGRYQTMRGRHVERRFGWDTHGLPAELEAEKVLGITDKTQIEGEGGVGIAAFNKAAKESVLKYTEEWKEYVTRQARWVDFDNDYKTLDLTYMESVIWAFKQLYDKGLIYQGFRVLPYCWNDETPLTNHELKMDDDVYQDRTDQSCTVGLRMESGELALIWTTTPWTLPSNLAITVGPDIDYVVVIPSEGDLAGERVLIAQPRVSAYAKELGEAPEVVETLKGSELVGRRYYPIFDYFASSEKLAEDAAPGPNAFTVVAADFVTTEDGTGLVHTAPAFGEEDMNVCQEYDIRAVVPVDSRARFTSEVPDYEGVQVFDANKLVLAHLREGSGPLARIPAQRRATLVRQESFTHSYPHCWRCRKPLIYKAETSWFVKVSAFRDRMVELNQQITWVPEYIKDGIFGNWLKGARDWSISRERFWGSPIPVWKSDNPAYPRVDVYGSLEELKRDFGVDVTNLHRPDIDDLVRPNPDDPTGRSMMRRVPEVLDTWFDSGSMPFAQVHYPFENRDWFEHHYPGDFIVEYIGQTRGWFYTLHVMATALFDRPSFTHCVSHGIVLGNDGRKMSKSLRNYPDPIEVFDQYGSDAMRWFLMASPVLSGGNLIVTEQAIRDTVRQTLLPMWNTYFFFTLYAGACRRIGEADGSGYHAHLLPLVGTQTNKPVENDAQHCLDGLETMDRYLLAHTAQLVNQVRDALDAYDVVNACSLVQSYLDVLTNWYVRTQRQRFWDEDARAFDTLYTALVTFMQVVDPLLPLLSEEIWRGLTGGESVHLTDYPEVAACVGDSDLVRAMDEVRDVVSAAHSLRKTNNLRVRQPLQDLLIVSELANQLTPFQQLVANEVNVKQVTLTTPADSGLSIHTELKLNPAHFAPDIKRSTSQLFKAQKSGEWTVSEDGQLVTFPGVQLEGTPVTLSVATGQCHLVQTVEAAPGEVATVMPNGTFVVLNAQVTPELEAEGFARDVVRAVQDERKNADLNISDRIHLTLGVPAEQMDAVNTWSEMIAHETLAMQVDVHQADALSVRVEAVSSK